MQLGARPKTTDELLDIQANYLKVKPEHLTYCETLYLNLHARYKELQVEIEKLKQVKK